MLFKYFKDVDSGQTVSINPNHVTIVREMSIGTKIIFDDSSYIIVDGSILEVAARLSEI
jgi:hypothetical protein